MILYIHVENIETSICAILPYMRIIAGSLGGRQFKAPKGNRTHPMSDKVRGALFNSLGDLAGKRILDAFAGSGALSFEALSREAEHAVAVDNDRRAYDALKENINLLGLHERCHAIRANVFSWSDNNPARIFSIVIAAPPYNKLQLHIINKLTRHVEKNGLFILDWPGKKEALELEGMELTGQKNYGDAQLLFYRREL